MPVGIYITKEDIKVLEGQTSDRGAYRRLACIKAVLNIERNITIREYAAHMRIDVAEVEEALGVKQAKKTN